MVKDIDNISVLFSIIIPAVVTLITLFLSELLKKMNIKENFKFTKLHEKRFGVLEKTYAALNKSLFCLQSYTDPFKLIPNNKSTNEIEKELQENFNTAHQEFLAYFNDNEFFFDRELAILIKSYNLEVKRIYRDYMIYNTTITLGISKDSKDSKEQITPLSAFVQISEKIDPIKLLIQDKFRKILEQ